MMKTGLKAISGPDSSVLILGSFPGAMSLAARQYYAHPQNLFWDMMDEICGAGRHHPYEMRCEILILNRIAVWDVLYACDREGSSDGRIKEFVVNDFTTFFSGHPCHTIFFNGTMAFKLFKRCVDSVLFDMRSLEILPSTSPANTGMAREEKKRQWRKIATCI